MSARRVNPRRSDWVIVVSFVALVLIMVASLAIGRYPVPLHRIAGIVFSTSPFGAIRDYTDVNWVVIELVRMPRILVATLSGMGLALAGAALQGVLRNPLVGPEVWGVSSGAAFGGVLGILLGVSSWSIVGWAFGFAFLALVLAFGLAQLATRGGMLALILSGVIVGSFFGAGVGLIQYLADPTSKLPSIVYWLLGSFAGATYAKVGIVAAVVLFGGVALVGLSWRINLLSLGESDARGLGVNVATLRWIVVALVALIVAGQVSVSGGVGFVGLIVPHLARMLVGRPNHTRLLPESALIGGIYLLCMDDIAHGVASTEVPIGLLTSFVGAPIFAFMFWKQHAKGWGEE